MFCELPKSTYYVSCCSESIITTLSSAIALRGPLHSTPPVAFLNCSQMQMALHRRCLCPTAATTAFALSREYHKWKSARYCYAQALSAVAPLTACVSAMLVEGAGTASGELLFLPHLKTAKSIQDGNVQLDKIMIRSAGYSASWEEKSACEPWRVASNLL